MSNHYHLVVTDPRGLICRFMQDLNAATARALNAYHNRSENVWSSRPASLVRLIEPSDVVEKMVYTLCNPVSSWLVREGRLWPGVRSDPEGIGSERTIPRPAGFFREEGETPKSAILRLVAPPNTEDGFRDMLAAAVSRREHELSEQARHEQRSFLGLRRLATRHREQSPSTPEPRSSPNPHFACKNTRRRKEVEAEWKQFLSDYRESLEEFVRGVRNVVFPAGTYLLRMVFGVRCASPPPS